MHGLDPLMCGCVEGGIQCVSVYTVNKHKL